MGDSQQKGVNSILAWLKEHNGKRALFGILLMALAAYGYITKLDTTATIAIFGMGSTLLGLTTVDK
jgi:hypothetical protein